MEKKYPQGMAPLAAAKSKVRYSGFLAQEVAVAAAETNFDFSGVDAPRGMRGVYGLRYAEFTVPLVKALQEQEEQINKLNYTNTATTKEIENFKTSLDKAEKKLSHIEAQASR